MKQERGGSAGRKFWRWNEKKNFEQEIPCNRDKEKTFLIKVNEMKTFIMPLYLFNYSEIIEKEGITSN